MSEAFCGPCGAVHSGAVDKNCNRKATRSSTRLAAMAAPSGSAAVKAEGSAAALSAASTGADTTSDISEDERALIKSIKKLEKKKRRIAELQARKSALEDSMADLNLQAEPSGRSSRSRSRSHDRHRHCRRHYSSSSSEGRTPSRERRQRSKWAIKRYVEDHKNVKKINPHELVEASCAWVADQKDLTVGGLLGFISHIGYMAGKAKGGRYLDSAHAKYDLGIRKLAAKSGFAAFTGGDPEVSLKYYSLDFCKEKKSSSSKYGRGGGKPYSRDGKKPCYLYNRSSGCTRDAKSCNFGHWCAKCGSRSHIKEDCSKE